MCMNSAQEERIILFDGVCNLCNRAVQFIIRRDPNALFKFCSLQSEYASRILARAGCSGSDLDTVLLFEDGKLYARSTAALKIARRLRFPWRLLTCLLLVPVPIRDMAYRLIAANRYRVFGRRESCLVPTAGDTQGRFVEFVPTDDGAVTDQSPNLVQ